MSWTVGSMTQKHKYEADSLLEHVANKTHNLYDQRGIYVYVHSRRKKISW